MSNQHQTNYGKETEDKANVVAAGQSRVATNNENSPKHPSLEVAAREVIVLDTFDRPVKISWNPNAVQLELDRMATQDGFVLFDGKEALHVIRFICSL